MVSSGMLHRMALVITDVSEEPSASFIRVTKIGELGTTLAAKKCQVLVFLRTVRRLPVAASVVPSSIYDLIYCKSFIHLRRNYFSYSGSRHFKIVINEVVNLIMP
jgi:hypothetical protein